MTMSVQCYLYSQLYGLPMSTQRKEKHTYFSCTNGAFRLLTFITCMHATLITLMYKTELHYAFVTLRHTCSGKSNVILYFFVISPLSEIVRIVLDPGCPKNRSSIINLNLKTKWKKIALDKYIRTKSCFFRDAYCRHT